jgi:hypothetical protein
MEWIARMAASPDYSATIPDPLTEACQAALDRAWEEGRLPGSMIRPGAAPASLSHSRWAHDPRGEG